jgi:hypothetical protein
MKLSEDDLSTAVATFRRSSSLEDFDLWLALVEVGLDRQVAPRLVELLPSVYCRILLRNFGCRFAKEYERKGTDGKNERRVALSTDTVWNVSSAFAEKEAATVSGQDLLAIAVRSPEFDAANKLLNEGSDLREIQFTPLLLTWPESGPNR